MTEKGNIALGVALIGVAVAAVFLIKRGGGETVTVDLIEGNNEIVFQGSTIPVALAFSGYEDKVASVWWWDEIGEQWYAWAPGAPSDLDYLVQGETYTVIANEDFQWMYPK
jgi:hypothetical protein